MSDLTLTPPPIARITACWALGDRDVIRHHVVWGEKECDVDIAGHEAIDLGSEINVRIEVFMRARKLFEAPHEGVTHNAPRPE